MIKSNKKVRFDKSGRFISAQKRKQMVFISGIYNFFLQKKKIQNIDFHYTGIP